MSLILILELLIKLDLVPSKMNQIYHQRHQNQ